MTADAWKKLEEAFQRALSLEGSAREAVVDDFGRNEPDLVQQLRDLLRADSASDTDFRQPIEAAVESLSNDIVDPWVGRDVGPWTILERLAGGGLVGSEIEQPVVTANDLPASFHLANAKGGRVEANAIPLSGRFQLLQRLGDGGVCLYSGPSGSGKSAGFAHDPQFVPVLFKHQFQVACTPCPALGNIGPVTLDAGSVNAAGKYI